MLSLLEQCRYGPRFGGLWEPSDVEDWLKSMFKYLAECILLPVDVLDRDCGQR